MIKKQTLQSLGIEFVKYIKDIWYSISLIVCTIATYGYFLTHYSVSIDDLSGDRYFYGELFAQGRFTNTILYHLFGFIDNSPWISDLIGLTLLAISSVVFCIIFDKYISFKNNIPKMIFSCLLVSAPIFSELFSYNGTCFTIGGGFLCVALSLYMLTLGLETKNYRFIILPAILLAIVASWYESLIIVYIDAVFALLILKYIQSKEKLKFKPIVIDGLYFVIPLFAGIFSEYIFQIIFLEVFNIQRSVNAPNSIAWFANGNTDLFSIIKSLIGNYVIAGIWNKTIAILIISMFISVVLCFYYWIKKKNFLLTLLFACLVFTNFILSFVSGRHMAYRMCQSFAFFTAFIFLLLFWTLDHSNKSLVYIFRKAISVLAIYFIVLQVSTSNYWYFWDYQRYQEEATVIEQVSNTLVQNYDISKPVVFTGQYELSDNILNHSHIKKGSFSYKFIDKIGTRIGMTSPSGEYARQISQTIVNSYINFGMTSFEGDNTELYKFIRFHGIDYLEQGTAEMVEEARKLAKNMPQWPQKNSIRDVGNYIIVNF